MEEGECVRVVEGRREKGLWWDISSMIFTINFGGDLKKKKSLE